MKKLICLLLCLVFLFCLTTSVAVAEESNVSEDVCSVDIEWTDLEFIYAPNLKGSWDHVSHTYTSMTRNGWIYDENSNIITVINNSSTQVRFDFIFTNGTGFESVLCSFEGLDGVTINEDSGSYYTVLPMVTDPVAPPTGRVQLIPNGTLSETVSPSRIGTLSVRVTVVN